MAKDRTAIDTIRGCYYQFDLYGKHPTPILAV